MFWHEYFSILSDVFVKQTNVGQLECCPKVAQKYYKKTSEADWEESEKHYLVQ